MVGAVCPGNVDALEDLLHRTEVRTLREAVDHLLDTLRAERVLGVDVYDAPVQPAKVFGELGVDGQLVDELALPGPELPVHLGYRLRLKTPADQFVELGDQGAEFLDVLPLVQYIPARLEPADIRHLPCGEDHLLRGPLADLGRLGEIRRGGRCNALDGPVARLAEFFGGGRPDAR